MLAVFKKSTGAYCDRADSFLGRNGVPSGVAWIRSHNVMGRNGGDESDYVVMEAGDAPHFRRLVNGELVDDADKLRAAADRDDALASERTEHSCLSPLLQTANSGLTPTLRQH